VALLLARIASLVSAKELRLYHQWSTSDIRHKDAKIVADEVAKANMDLEIKIFPTKSLFKPREQY
jgi:TRAP-type C4-dicarboxylate transport system substrate-binding protein